MSDKLKRLCEFSYSFCETVQNTYDLTSEVIRSGIRGCLVECGVGAGAQIGAMALANDDFKGYRSIVGLDSFEGIPLCGPRDESQPGIGAPSHDVNLPIAERLVSSGVTSHGIADIELMLKARGVPIESVEWVKGWFQDTVPHFNRDIALLRLDGDLYESTYVCLQHLYPMVAMGGIVIIDDYALPGCREAVKRYLLENEISMMMRKVPPVENGVVWFRKADY